MSPCKKSLWISILTTRLTTHGKDEIIDGDWVKREFDFKTF